MKVTHEEFSEDRLIKQRWTAEVSSKNTLVITEYDELATHSTGRPYRLKKAWRSNPWNNKSLRHDGVEVLAEQPKLERATKAALLKKAREEIRWP